MVEQRLPTTVLDSRVKVQITLIPNKRALSPPIFLLVNVTTQVLLLGRKVTYNPSCLTNHLKEVNSRQRLGEGLKYQQVSFQEAFGSVSSRSKCRKSVGMSLMTFQYTS